MADVTAIEKRLEIAKARAEAASGDLAINHIDKAVANAQIATAHALIAIAEMLLIGKKQSI